MSMSYGASIIPVASKLLKEEERNSLLMAYSGFFEQAGASLLSDNDVATKKPLFYFVLTGGTEKAILELNKLRKGQQPQEPVYLITHPGNNSLPAALEVLARLRQMGEKGQVFYLHSPEDFQELEKIKKTTQVLKIRQFFNEIRLGLIGSPSDWLVASRPKANVIKASWGPELVVVSTEELLKKISDVKNEDIVSVVGDMNSNVADIKEPTDGDMEGAAKVYIALKRIIEEYHLNALSIRCFDLVDKKMTGCFALSKLTDEGIISACEGDLMSAIGMLWAHLLTEKMPWMANPVQIYKEEKSLVLAHCTVPRIMVKSCVLRSHFESDIGVGLQGDFEEGPVTLLRIGGKEMEETWFAEGKIIPFEHAENLCRTQVKIQLSDKTSLDELLTKPLGNHLIMVFGHHKETFEAWND